MAVKLKVSEESTEAPVAMHDAGMASPPAVPAAVSGDASPKIRLDLGCGNAKLKGWIGYDIVGPDTKKVDVVHDLEKTPWPGKENTHVALVPWDGLVWMWPDSSVEEARFHHSLEYMAASGKALRAIFAELHRVMRPGGLVFLDFLNPRHPAWLDDPDAVRPLTPALLEKLGGFKIIGDSSALGAPHERVRVTLETVKVVPEED